MDKKKVEDLPQEPQKNDANTDSNNMDENADAGQLISTADQPDTDDVETNIEESEKTSSEVSVKSDESKDIVTYTLPNAMRGKKYIISLKDYIPEMDGKQILKGIERIDGLEFDTENNFIRGIPEINGSFIVELIFHEKNYLFELYINPDPKSMWKNIPSDQKYKKDDYYSMKLLGDRLAIGASRRGLSHAHDGTPRDDHYSMDEMEGWAISVVADGAGSSRLSTLGSKLICEEIINFIKGFLDMNLEQFEDSVRKRRMKKINQFLYDIFGGGVISAYRRLEKAASENKDISSVKDLNTTVLITLSKKINENIFISGFQIGDGISAVYDELNCKVHLLGEPDSGIFSGQTRFITNTKILKSGSEINERIRFSFFRGNVLIISMTDGITDAFFLTDKELENSDRWKEFWNQIEPLTRFKGQSGPDQKLFDWTGFYKQGEFDDRTLLVIV